VRYDAVLKSAADARRDRLAPLLAQAILEARRAAAPGASPLAIVGAARIPAALARHLQAYAADVAPEVAVGIVDLEGGRAFRGPELQALDARPPIPPPDLLAVSSLKPSGHLFSDLNQWMLKVLLAPGIPEPLLQAPRGELRNVSGLAQAAGVSLMSASRCVRLLRADGYLELSPRGFRLVRVDELLHRWRAATAPGGRDLPLRWIIPKDPDRQLGEALHAYLGGSDSPASRRPGRRAGGPPSRPRACLGLFAAAEALGLGFVRGVAPHLYLERLDRRALDTLGLAPADPGQPVDVFVRVPPAREAVFRAAVNREGLPVSDILQVWLDVADHPSRGGAQAHEIWRRVLAPLVKDRGRAR
jgi:hypothetical protein